LATSFVVALVVCAAPQLASAETVPLPANAGTTPDATVNSISCPAAGDCSAVGYYMDDGGNTELLLLSQHDGNWSPTEGDISALAGASGGIEAKHADLSATSVSCGDPGDCSVIGGYQDGTSDFHFRGFVLTESGGVWGAAQPVVLPVNADTSATFEPYTNLYSISCGSAGDCSAVGTYRATSAGNVEGLQLLQTNGTWTAATEAALPSSGATAAAADPDVYLPSVSCGATGICLAFGDYSLLSGGNAGLVLSDNGGSWTVSAVQPTGLTDASHSPAYLQLGDWSSGGDRRTAQRPVERRPRRQQLVARVCGRGQLRRSAVLRGQQEQSLERAAHQQLRPVVDDRAQHAGTEHGHPSVLRLGRCCLRSERLLRGDHKHVARRHPEPGSQFALGDKRPRSVRDAVGDRRPRPGDGHVGPARVDQRPTDHRLHRHRR
jgi:hypothetical protein